ncbi:putative beta-galactosidase [Exidia glandulosa HHB12029]|uniref:Beta-galactosidase n=1 Tax=Exidia glandulosa HHB12029 TaxID=1314781 RepID=A0A165M871_EXIGL|nr:putative beta-galactosidase [Exidia glandulosa HHB12029]
MDDVQTDKKEAALLQKSRAMTSTKSQTGPTSSVWFRLALAACLLYLLPWDKLLHTLPDSLPALYKSLLAIRTPEPRALSSSGLTDLVQWDEYSLFVKGQRIFLWSGEFHTFRLPVPSLWPDILEKMKAAGLNAVSIYIDWALVHPSPDALDFDGFRALQPFFDACMAAGLWLVIRPGPYINAEVNAGGIPGWVTSEVAGHLRSNDTDFEDAWVPYMRRVIELSRGAQITEGGPIIAWQIENEYTADPNVGVPGKAEYMARLEEFVRAEGIVVPLTFNDASRDAQFAPGKKGEVDIYGIDSYPQSFDCSNPGVWKEVDTSYYSYHRRTNPRQPFYIPEFQGGAFDPWGPNAPGYDKCRTLTGPEFESVFYLQLWASNVKLINLYMLYGGTSWGSLPFPGVYTSYDYGSPILENRSLGSKYTELKREGLFLRSTPEFAKTDVKGNSTDGTGVVTVDNEKVFVTALVNPDSGAGFYIARQTNSSSLDNVTFKMTVPTSEGALSIPHATPPISLSGRQSKVIVTDYAFGSDRMLYSTASVLFAGIIDGRNVLFLHGDVMHSHEILATLSSNGHSALSASHEELVTLSHQQHNGRTLISIMHGVKGFVTLWESDKQLVLYADSDTAGTFWAPVLSSSSNDFGAFWSIGTNDTVIVGGPYLVREASLVENGDHLALRGDLQDDAFLTVIGPRDVKTISWNGQPVEPLSSAKQSTGIFVGRLQTTKALRAFTPPKLTKWKFKDGLPEIASQYDDSKWVTADHESTNLPYKPLFGAPPVLYGCDYGFCEGSVLWRGHFKGSADTTGVNLTINGGEAFAASVWINDRFVKTTYGNSTNNLNIIAETNELYEFPKGAVKMDEDNVITVLQDNQGLDETDDWDADTSKSPRGIRGALLIGGEFSSWKVQGKLGGYTQFADKDRGVVNEGGTFGERAGWHLPSFDVSQWKSRDLSKGLPTSGAGVGVFVTKFQLDTPRGVDLHMSFVFDDGVGDTGVPYRAYLYVNGWMMGKRVANLGPQAKFPVHEGILDYHGDNTVAVVLWAMEASAAVRPTLQIVVDGRYDSGMAAVAVHNPGWSTRPEAL